MQIKETMQRYGYTPTSLAKKMGVYASTVIRLTEGNPTVDKLDELARWIGCQRWEFFADEIAASGMSVVSVGNPSSDGHVDDVVEQSQVAAGAGDGIATIKDYGGDADLPFNDETGGGAKEGPKKAESEQFQWFKYDCPYCGHEVRISIQKV